MANQGLNMERFECHVVALFYKKWRTSATMILPQSSFKSMLAMVLSEEFERKTNLPSLQYLIYPLPAF